MKIKHGDWLLKTALALIFVFSLTRLIYYAYDFSLHTLQVDFSAYYTAGEALNNHLSPYKNNIQHDPPIWDGTNDYQHSRFLYPPLVANLFQPLALIPYFGAKIIWNILSLLAIALSLYMTAKIFPMKDQMQVLLLGACVCLYFPLLPHMERGQIDAFTLLLLTLSLYLLTQKDHAVNQWLAGGYIALAILLKLHCMYVLPFLFLKKRWPAIAGSFATGLILLVLGITINLPLFQDYAFQQLPRIANYGTPDHGDMLLDPSPVQEQIKGLPEGYTRKDGRTYKVATLNFSGNATLVRPFHDMAVSLGWRVNHTAVSLALYIFFFILMMIWQHFFPQDQVAAEAEFIHWQAILVVVLLTAPLTHVMNTVWVLPVFVLLVSRFRVIREKFGYFVIWLFVTGMALIAVPDAANIHVPAFIAGFLKAKYMIGEFTVFIACLLFPSQSKQSERSKHRLT
jgi:hypothetical protein